VNRDMTFCYISGKATNENGPQMWQRVKGKTESDLQKLPFKSVYLFRPGYLARSEEHTEILQVSFVDLSCDEAALSKRRLNPRRTRPGHAQRGRPWISEARAGGQGYCAGGWFSELMQRESDRYFLSASHLGFRPGY